MWIKSWICSVTEEENWSITPTNQWHWLVLDTHLLQAIKHKQRDSLDVNVVLRISFPCTEAHKVQSRWNECRENAVRCLQPKNCEQQWTHAINKHNVVDRVSAILQTFHHKEIATEITTWWLWLSGDTFLHLASGQHVCILLIFSQLGVTCVVLVS